MAVTKKQLLDYILTSPYDFNGNIFIPMLEEYANAGDIELPDGVEDLDIAGADSEEVATGKKYLYWDAQANELKIGTGTGTIASEPESPGPEA